MLQCNGSDDKVEITIEYVGKTGVYEVFRQDDDEFFGSFYTLESAFNTAWHVCPAGGLITECNLNDDEFEQMKSLKAAAEARDCNAAFRMPRRRNPITGHFLGGGRGER